MIEQVDGRLVGSWERPRNIAADRKGSIHDDEPARELGFRGALVSSRVHLNVVVPLALEAFGNRWFERGTVSLDFRVGTLDGEPVRAVVDAPPPDASHAHVDARLEKQDGTVIATGTLGVGDPPEPTFLGAKDLSRYDGGGYELVSAVTPGDVFEPREIVLGERAAERMIGGVGHPWYRDSSPWGPAVASPSLMVNALGAACVGYLRDHPVRGVAIDGANELRNVNGPVLLDRPYVASGEVIARGRSPRTEYFWYEGRLDDPSGVRVAEMLLQWRTASGSR